MQAIMETLFDICYLSTVIILVLMGYMDMRKANRIIGEML